MVTPTPLPRPARRAPRWRSLALIALGVGCDDAPATDDARVRRMSTPATPIGWIDRTAAAGLAGVTTRCATVSFADVDGDGDLDLVVPTAGLRVFRNDGRGHFAPWVAMTLLDDVAREMYGRCPQVVRDLDGDGRVDVAVALADGRLAVWWGERDGTLTPQTVGVAAAVRASPFAAAWLAGAGVAPILFVGNEFDGAAQKQNCGYDPRGVNVECRVEIREPAQAAFRFEGRAVTAVADAALLAPGNVQGAGAVDLDRDGVDDLVLAVDFAPQRALRRTAAGFVDVSRATGVDVFGHGMGVALSADTLIISTIGGLIDYARTPTGFAFRGDDSALMDRKRNVWPWQVDLVDLNADGRLDVLQINGFSLEAAQPDPVQWMMTLGNGGDFVGNFDSIFVARADGGYDERHLAYASLMAGSGRGVAAAIGDLGAGGVELALPVTQPRTDVFTVVLGRPDFSAR